MKFETSNLELLQRITKLNEFVTKYKINIGLWTTKLKKKKSKQTIFINMK